jgi:hypothetical protein
LRFGEAYGHCAKIDFDFYSLGKNMNYLNLSRAAAKRAKESL